MNAIGEIEARTDGAVRLEHVPAESTCHLELHTALSSTMAAVVGYGMPLFRGVESFGAVHTRG